MKRALIVLAAVVLAAAAALVAYGLYKKHEGRDVRGSSSVEFVTTQAKRPPKLPTSVFWPTYRYDAARNGAPRGIPASTRPPFKVRWYFRGRELVEFPPTIAYGRLYFANANGKLFAVDIKLHGAVWQRWTRRCTAATPAVADHTVFMTFLNKPPCNADRSGLDGETTAMDADTGKVRWRVRMGPSESSPLVVGNLVYVGDWRGKVYALSTRTGRTVWSYQTGNKVKDGLANAPISGSAVVINGVVYFSSFKGRTYAADARSGKLLWYFRRGKYGAVVADKQWLYLVGYARVFAMAPKARG